MQISEAKIMQLFHELKVWLYIFPATGIQTHKPKVNYESAVCISLLDNALSAVCKLSVSVLPPLLT